ncbi:hypothetical protein HMPREF0262_00566 [Clostridium sp. ATCC 29733]|nr:hypothetical protein HMPREF0262_00566 [Clostridium sp. ATCC 29733]
MLSPAVNDIMPFSKDINIHFDTVYQYSTSCLFCQLIFVVL